MGSQGDYMDLFKVKDFVLLQAETDEFEWQNQKYYPKGKEPKGPDGKPLGSSGPSAEALQAALKKTPEPIKAPNDSAAVAESTSSAGSSSSSAAAPAPATATATTPAPSDAPGTITTIHPIGSPAAAAAASAAAATPST
jgi:hypothetical protein